MKNQDLFNKINLEKIAILLLVVGILLILYNKLIKPMIGGDPLQTKILILPNEIKCAFGERDCENGDLNGWSVAHFLMYFLIGIVVPGEYGLVILFSIIFELIEPIMGSNSKFIADPIVNFLGYLSGSQLSKCIY